MAKVFWFFILLNTFSYCVIRHSQNTLELNSSLTFSQTGSVINEYSDYRNYTSRNNVNMLDCSANFKKDLYFYMEIEYACIQFCDRYAIGSCVPFYVSKVDIDSINFTKNLNLKDTNIFYKVDTLKNEVPLQCARPHIHAGAHDETHYPKFLIINTAYGNVLITYKDLWESFQDPELGTINFYTAIRMDSYLQDDKSLNFSEIPKFLQTKTKASSRNISRAVVSKNKSKYYDLKGSIISNSTVNNRILISKDKKLLIIH